MFQEYWKDTSLFYMKIYTNISLVAASERRVWSNFCNFNHCKGLNWIFQTLECTHQQWMHSYLSVYLLLFGNIQGLLFPIEAFLLSMEAFHWSDLRSMSICSLTVALSGYFRSSFCLVFQLNCFIKREWNTQTLLTLVFRKLEKRVGILCLCPCSETMLWGSILALGL